MSVGCNREVVRVPRPVAPVPPSSTSSTDNTYDQKGLTTDRELQLEDKGASEGDQRDNELQVILGQRVTGSFNNLI